MGGMEGKGVNMHQLRELIATVEECGVAKLDISDDGQAIRIKRARVYRPPHSASTVATGTVSAEPVQSGDDLPIGDVVRSPLVGTFHRALAPDGKRLVEVGDLVGNDDILCIISALKIQNPIKTGMPGRISAILVEDAQPVEYDQPLFIIARRQETQRDPSPSQG